MPLLQKFRRLAGRASLRRPGVVFALLIMGLLNQSFLAAACISCEFEPQGTRHGAASDPQDHAAQSDACDFCCSGTTSGTCCVHGSVPPSASIQFTPPPAVSYESLLRIARSPAAQHIPATVFRPPICA